MKKSSNQKTMLLPFANLPDDYVVIDTETTGFADKDGQPGLCSLGIVKVRDRKPVDFCEMLVKPHRSMTAGATKINGFTDSMVKEHNNYKDISEDINTLLDNEVVVVHNAMFDMPVITTACDVAGVDRPKPKGIFCSLKESRAWGAEIGIASKYGVSLDRLVEYFDLSNMRNVAGVHGALIDARMTQAVVEKLRLLALE